MHLLCATHTFAPVGTFSKFNADRKLRDARGLYRSEVMSPDTSSEVMSPDMKSHGDALLSQVGVGGVLHSRYPPL